MPSVALSAMLYRERGRVTGGLVSHNKLLRMKTHNPSNINTSLKLEVFSDATNPININPKKYLDTLYNTICENIY